MQHNRHKGYTLIEILVAFAVLGIAILGIGGFFVSASRSYSSVNDETSLQYEAQLALNQMENMLIDSALGVSYNYVTTADESSSGYNFVESDNSLLGDAVSKALYVFNINEEDPAKLDILLMKWVAEKKSIYYKEIQVTNSSLEVKDIDISGVTGDWDLLAEDVTEFSVDLSDYKRTKKVQIDLGIENRSKDYHTTGTVVLRNDILINEPAISKIYEHISILRKSLISGVELRANTNVTIPGGIVQLYTKVLGTGYPDQRIYQWVVASDVNFNNVIYDSLQSYDPMPATYVDSGTKTLYVSDQTVGCPETLHVKAVVRTVDAEGDEVFYEAVESIGIKVINDIVVSVTADTTQEYNSNLTGATFEQAKLSVQRVNPTDVPSLDLSHKNIVKLSASVSASGTITAEERAISWSVHSQDPGVLAVVDTTGQLKISQYSRVGNFVVRATLKLDRSVYVDYAVRVVTEYNSTNTRLEIMPSKVSVNRGGNLACGLKLNGETVDPADYNWSVSVVNSKGQSITGNPVVVNGNGEVYVNYDLSYDYAYDVWIRAVLKTNSDVFGSVKITVPKVTMSLSPATSYAVMGATVSGFTCTATGLESYNIKWTMAKDVNPHYYFTAWGNFNITGAKLADGRDTAVVVMGSKKDPLTDCTVKATLENNTNYSATAQIITSDVEMNITGLNSKTGATGVKTVSRGSFLPLQVSLSKEDPNISISNNTVKWEVVNVKIAGATQPDLLDGTVSISNDGVLSLTSEFAKAHNDKNVDITVRAWEDKHGLEATYTVTVPYMTITGLNRSTGAGGVTTVSRGSSLPFSATLSLDDPNVTVSNSTVNWEVVKVKVGSSNKPNLKDASISFTDEGVLVLTSEFAKAYNKKTVTIEVRAWDELHGLEDTYSVTVPYLTLAGVTSIARGVSGDITVSLSAADPNVTINANTLTWTITKVKVNSSTRNDLIDNTISLKNGRLTLGKSFAIQYHDNSTVEIEVTATDELHNLIATRTVKVLVVSLNPSNVLFVPNTSSSTLTFSCPAAQSWQVCDLAGNVLGTEAPVTINSTSGKLTIKASNAVTADYKEYIIRAVLPEDAGYKDVKVRYGFCSEDEVAYASKTPYISEKKVDGVKYESHLRFVQSDYKTYTNPSYYPVGYVLHEVYKCTVKLPDLDETEGKEEGTGKPKPDDPGVLDPIVEKELVSSTHYALVSSKTTYNGSGQWYVFNESAGKWEKTSTAPEGWNKSYFK